MEWTDGYGDDEPRHGQFHRAEPDGQVPVVKGAGGAVLTNPDRARSLSANACPDCFPDEAADGPLTSVIDTETGERVTYNVDCIDEAPQEVVERFRSMREAFWREGQQRNP